MTWQVTYILLERLSQIPGNNGDNNNDDVVPPLSCDAYRQNFKKVPESLTIRDWITSDLEGCLFLVRYRTNLPVIQKKSQVCRRRQTIHRHAILNEECACGPLMIQDFDSCDSD